MGKIRNWKKLKSQRKVRKFKNVTKKEKRTHYRVMLKGVIGWVIMKEWELEMADKDDIVAVIPFEKTVENVVQVDDGFQNEKNPLWQNTVTGSTLEIRKEYKFRPVWVLIWKWGNRGFFSTNVLGNFRSYELAEQTAIDTMKQNPRLGEK